MIQLDSPHIPLLLHIWGCKVKHKLKKKTDEIVSEYLLYGNLVIKGPQSEDVQRSINLHRQNLEEPYCLETDTYERG